MSVTAAAEQARLDLPVSGMTCAACARTIERTLASTDGVADARVNFATGTATVEYNAAKTGREEIVAAIRDVGYDVQEGEEDDGLAPRLGVAAICAAAVMALAMAGRLKWEQFGLSLPVMFFAALPFFRDAWSGLRHRTANMNTLIALGSGTAFVYSTVELFRGRTDLYFEAACVIVALILLGRVLERRARRKASESVRMLLDLRPQTARVERDGLEAEVPASDLRVGDLVVARPGERLACDGVVESGESAVDESTLTGESMPVEKAAGAQVFRGTVNRFGSMRVRAERVGADTALDRIIELVAQAQNSRAPVARLADTVSGYFTFVVLGIAVLTAAVWLLFAPGLALTNAVAVLIVACPCALGLATPVAIVAGTGHGARRGILIKSGEALEAAARVDTVVFDKTGTLTEGKPVVERVVAADGFGQEQVLRWAAAAEGDSEHPLALAIRDRAGNGWHPVVSGFRATAGFGVSATVDGHAVAVHRPERTAAGSDALLDEFGGATIAAVTVDGAAAGWIGIADQVRPEAREAVRRLLQKGFHVKMLTGDSQPAALRIAAELGIAEVGAELLPEEKEREIEKLRAGGRHVAMAGDGINDAPALARADVGIALASGSDIAAEAGAITILRNDLRAVPEALDLARRTMRVIRQNLFWAFAYNVIALPLAAGVLYPVKGWLLSPTIASAAMAFSSLSVVLNSLRLLRDSA